MAKAKMRQVVIPKFSSEAEEAAWWDTHRSEIETEIRQRMRQRTPLTLGNLLQGTKPSQPVTLRIAKEDLETARRLAAQKGLRYQTYIKMLLREALPEGPNRGTSGSAGITDRERYPIGIGTGEAQKQFLRDHEAFIRESAEIYKLLHKTFIRQLVPPSDEQIKRLEHLSNSDPSVIQFEDKVMADRTIFYLGRVAADDFGELVTLSGNGWGFGAFKILRGMFERIVTAAFIAKFPSKARAFIEGEAIEKWKLWRRAVEVVPDLESRYSSEEIRTLERRYKEAQAKRSLSYCKTCKQPKTQEAWTRVDLASMAKTADVGLAELYGSCYLEPTFHSHPTSLGLERRLRPSECGGFTYRDSSPQEATRAVLLGHNLVLRLLALQNNYFRLGLDEEVNSRFSAFAKVWDKQDRADMEETAHAQSR